MRLPCLQRLLQFAREDSLAAKPEKLQRTLARYRFPQGDTVPLLAALLSLPHPEGYPPLMASPQKQKEKTQAALVAWLVEEAGRSPVCTIWEDLHWADPSTLEVLNLVVDQAPTAKLCVLLTFRPEFLLSWGNRSHLSQLTLSRLGHSQVEAMIERVMDGRLLPQEIVQQIVAKTDGVPLFIEELTKTVVESGLLTAVNDHYELSGPLPPLAIPSTLQDSLMARLDRLAPVKEIAQMGAVLGREFSYELLHAVSSLDEATLQCRLTQLVKAELVYQRGLLPQAHYLFKHALIQDTAYQSLLKSTRQQYHRQIAQVLADRFPETVETQPELVGHHYTQAGLVAQSLPYWLKAGERASQRSAYVEAISHLTRGLEVLKTLPETPEHIQHELGLQYALGTTLMVTKGYGALEVERAYARALELGQQLGETPQLVPVLRGLVTFYFTRAELKPARELAEQCVSLAQSVRSPTLLMPAHGILGQTLFYLGEFALVQIHMEQALTRYNPQKPKSQVSGTLVDWRVHCLHFAAMALWELGYPDQALKRSQTALTLAQELSHPFSLANALFSVTRLYQFRQEEHRAQEWAEATITLSTEQGFAQWLAYGTFCRGWALAAQEQVEEGIAQMQKGLAARQATGQEAWRTSYLAELATAYEKVGQAEVGLALLVEALTQVHRTGERVYEAELYRLKGTLTLQLQVESHKSKVEEAEKCFLKAIEIAQRQQAKSLELRAATSLARLWQRQDKQQEAHQLLSEIYGWFTEGFETKDLQEAKALIEELSD